MPNMICKYSDMYCDAFRDMLGACFSQDYGMPLTTGQLEHLCAEILSQVSVNIQFLDLLIADGATKGFIIYQIDSPDSDWCEKKGYGCIRELYIAADLRGKGHGRSLAAHAEARLRNLSVPGIYLTTDEAMAFWVKQGYHDTGEICPKNNGRIFIK